MFVRVKWENPLDVSTIPGLMIANWSPIRDYEESSIALEVPELSRLYAMWKEQRERIRTTSTFNRFEIELKREWAIETGLIERLYSFNQSVTDALIKSGIRADLIPPKENTDSKLVELMIKDQESALEHVIAFDEQGRELTPSFIKELHSLITQHQDFAEGRDQFGRRVKLPLKKGEFKKKPNNPTISDGSIYEYCPPEHVDAEMDRLCELHRQHKTLQVSPEVEAAWLHHCFINIHPFQDGNGRVARSLATLVFVQAGWFPLVVRDRERTRYIDCLERADAGNLHDLITFFGELQQQTFFQVLSIAQSSNQI